ncbi:MAG: hypothetical protein IJZ75_03625 [Clostridia bacterium]|nr:hypothetical protein [Clostridia bacterium]
MQTFNFKDEPIKVFGAPMFKETGTHPNDNGFLRMADILEPVFKKALNI